MPQGKMPTIVDKLVGSKIREARKAEMLTQIQLGGMVNRTFQQIQKYERGVNRISAGALFEIAQVLNRDIAWFFDDAQCVAKATPREQDSKLFSECVHMLVELRESSKLDSVKSVLELARQSPNKPRQMDSAA